MQGWKSTIKSTVYGVQTGWKIGRWNVRSAPQNPIGFALLWAQGRQGIQWLRGVFSGSVVFLGLSIGATVALLHGVNFFQPLEWQGYRLLFSARNALSASNTLSAESRLPLFPPNLPPNQWDDRLALIAIDDQSLKSYGQFATWKRDRYTELLNLLQNSPPAAIGFAMLFPEETPEDPPLAEAMLVNGTIVLGLAQDSQGNTLLPWPFLDSSAGLGHVQSVSDPDGITRSTWLYLPTEDSAIPSLGVALAQVYNETLQSLGSQASQASIPIPPPQPSLEGNQVWINWPAPAQQLPQYSLAAVLKHQVHPDTFANKIVLVGITATGLESNPLRTPFYGDAKGSGVYLYAATLDNLLNDRFLRRPAGLWVSLGLVVLGGISALGLHRLALHWQLVTVVFFPLFWFSAALLGFYAQWWFPLAAPILTLWLTGIALQARSYNDRQLLMDLFSKHVSTWLTDKS